MIFPIRLSPPACLSLFLVLNVSAGLSRVNAQNSLTIAAASDLSPLEPLLKEAFPVGNLTFTFASSGVLARQIENGAPFDLFLSASEEFMNQLVKKRKVAKEEIQIYAIGRIGLWGKSGAVKTLRDLTQPGVKVIAIANPQLAPYGAAAIAALQKSGMYERVQPMLVYGENVRQAMQFVETGNAEAGILAWSLIYDKGGYLVPDDLHPALRQVAAPVSRKGGNAKGAEEFIQFLLSPVGRGILARHGFNLLPPPPRLRR